MKRLCIFTSDLYQGGVAESTRKILELVVDNYQIDLVVYDDTPILKKIPDGVTLYNIGMPLSANFASGSSSSSLRKVLRCFGFVYAFIFFFCLRVIRRPDFVYSLTYIPNVINILTRMAGGKTIVSERQDPTMDLVSRPLISFVLRSLYKHSDKVHVNSSGVQDSVCGFYSISKNHIALAENFFFLDEICLLGAEEPEFVIPPGFIIVTSGRLSKQKGQWHLIKALQYLPENYKLLVLGDGELKEELAKLAKADDVEDRVFFLGDVMNPHSIVSRCDLFVFPSIWESFGNSLVEAMILGKPVISTSCKSGPGEIIDRGRYGVDIGVLSSWGQPNDDAVRLSRSILDISRPEELKKYSMLAEHGVIRYDARAVKEKFIELFS